jgi:hypothetical protein
LLLRAAERKPDVSPICLIPPHETGGSDRHLEGTPLYFDLLHGRGRAGTSLCPRPASGSPPVAGANRLRAAEVRSAGWLFVAGGLRARLGSIREPGPRVLDGIFDGRGLNSMGSGTPTARAAPKLPSPLCRLSPLHSAAVACSVVWSYLPAIHWVAKGSMSGLSFTSTPARSIAGRAG